MTNGGLSSSTRARWTTTALVSALTFLAACDNPVQSSSSHIEATEMVLRDSTGAQLARTHNNTQWIGDSLRSRVGQAPIVRVSMLDIRGEEFSLDAFTTHSVRVESEPANLVMWEPFGSYGKLTGLAAGSGRVRILIWHITHPDFVTPWMPVAVAP
ncbi:MAG: hypothetical protein ACO1Q7_20110 [Gemmatimonas sp.]